VKILFICSLFVAIVQASVFVDNSGDGDWLDDGNWDTPPVDTEAVTIDDAEAVLQEYTSFNLNSLNVGVSGQASLTVDPGSINATANVARHSYIGVNNGSDGELVSNGNLTFNSLTIGSASGSNGSVEILGGDLTINRAVNTTKGSLIVGDNGVGSFLMAGGYLTTRNGVSVGFGSGIGTFFVKGSGVNKMAIGSKDSLDGFWYQGSGSTLDIEIDANGVTPIFIDYVDGNAGAGGVTFESGSLLNLSFADGVDLQGSWDVMIWEGSLTDNGLQFADSVDTGRWSKEFVDTDDDGQVDTLRVTSNSGDPVESTDTVTQEGTTYTVYSIDQLRAYSAMDNITLKLSPGTYWMQQPLERIDAAIGVSLLDLSGSNTTYDFTDTEIKVSTKEFAGYGSGNIVSGVTLTGDGSTVDGLNLSMEHVSYAGLDAYGELEEYASDGGSVICVITGSNTAFKNCYLKTGGSYPYGYGDAFGKGPRPNTNGVTNAAFISHRKQSAFLITNGANNVLIEDFDIDMRSYGHAFFMQNGASDITFRRCNVLGDEMVSSNVIKAHEEYLKWDSATYWVPIPDDIYISKHEDCFRVYDNSQYAVNGYDQYITNITVEDCRVERMRTGVAAADGRGTYTVSGTTVIDCEMGINGGEDDADNVITNCSGNAHHGPLLYFQRSGDNSVIDIELLSTTTTEASAMAFPIAIISGSGHDITIRNSAEEGDYLDGAYINLSQKWREWRHRPAEDLDELYTANYADYTTNSVIRNYTYQPLVFGVNATDNTDCISVGGVINKGTNNTYTGQTLVTAPIVIQDIWTSPNQSLDVSWAQFSGTEQILPTAPYTVFSGLGEYSHSLAFGGAQDDTGTKVYDGGMLQINAQDQLQGEDLYLNGRGFNDLGALYAVADTTNRTRVNTTSGTVYMETDAAVGVEGAGNKLLFLKVGGEGNLHKVGEGILNLENQGITELTGDIIVEAGEIHSRQNEVLYNLEVYEGATFAQMADQSINQGADNYTKVDGTLNLNVRSVSDTNAFQMNVGQLSGEGIITSTSEETVQTLNVNSSSQASVFDGVMTGSVSLVKNGAESLSLSGAHTNTGETYINEGTLILDGSLPATSDVFIGDSARLEGTGQISSTLYVASGGIVDPATDTGELTVSNVELAGGSTLVVNMSAPDADAGVGRNYLNVQETLTLGDDVSAENPIILSLQGVSIETTSLVDQKSWVVLDPTTLSGDFDPSFFQVETPDYTLQEGDLVVTQDGNALSLTYQQSTSADLIEQWRDTYFTDSDESGNDADPDNDGLSNLLEYALGQNPRDGKRSKSSVRCEMENGSLKQLTFDIVDDPQLVYEVQCSTDLSADSWTAFDGVINYGAGEATVEPSATEDLTRQFYRVEVSISAE